MYNFGIYVHWPFCITKCPYCDFNSHIKKYIEDNELDLDLTTELHYLYEKYY